MTARLLEALEPAVHPAPGQLTLPDGRDLRWNASGVTLTHTDGRSITLADGDLAAIQVSRGRTLQPRPAWLGLIPRRPVVVHRLYVDLRPSAAHPHARLRLSAPVDDPARLDGLPWLTGTSADVELDALVALVGVARTLGGELLPWRPEDERAPVEGDPEPPPPAPTHVWYRRGAIGLAAATLSCGLAAVALLLYGALTGPLQGLTPGLWLLAASLLTAITFAALWLAVGPVRLCWSESAQRLTLWHGLLAPRWLRPTVQRAAVADIHWIDTTWLSMRQVWIALTHKGGRTDLVEVRTWQPDEARALFVDLREALELPLGQRSAQVSGARKRHRRARWQGVGVMLALSVGLAVAGLAVVPDATRPDVPTAGWTVRQAEPSAASRRRHLWNGRSPWYGENARADRFSDHTKHLDHGVVALAWSPDGSRLASGSASGVRVWDVDTAWPVRDRLAGAHVQGLQFSPDGQTLLVLGRDELWAWTADEGIDDDWNRRTPSVASKAGLRWAHDAAGACWHPDEAGWMGAERVTPCNAVPRSDVVAWITPVQQLDHHIQLPSEDAVAVLRAGEHVALRCDAHAGQSVVALSPDCTRAVVVVERADPGRGLADALDTVVARYELGEAQPQWVTAIDHHSIVPVQARFGGDRLAVLGQGRLWLWRLDAAEPLELACDDCTALDLSPDGTTLALGVGWEVHTVDLEALDRGVSRPEATASLGTHGEGEVLSVAFSPDGRVLASGCDDETVRLWPLAERTGADLSVAPP